jgi:hypothetical protein
MCLFKEKNHSGPGKESDILPENGMQRERNMRMKVGIYRVQIL